MTITPSAALMDAIVLAVVAREETTYGYKITQDIRAVMEISESTLYPVLRRLQKDGCLEVHDQEFSGRNRRYYSITPRGREQLRQTLEEWESYKDRLDRIFYGSERI
ncbi:MAG: helix-turn-helix transcriptional regulator [Angelakisella sp.]|jgi:PadR family transcriptional regulator PadR|nr:helix-turn-helix transcriptional regulator [Angelakisella sp.]